MCRLSKTRPTWLLSVPRLGIDAISREVSISCREVSCYVLKQWIIFAGLGKAKLIFIYSSSECWAVILVLWVSYERERPWPLWIESSCWFFCISAIPVSVTGLRLTFFLLKVYVSNIVYRTLKLTLFCFTFSSRSLIEHPSFKRHSDLRSAMMPLNSFAASPEVY